MSLAYRRGIDRFVITTRLRGDGAWSDPLAAPEGYVETPRRIALPIGAAELVVSPNTQPHLWAIGNHLVVTVGGDLERVESTRIARSLGR